jgi:phage tail sheath protein FI
MPGTYTYPGIYVEEVPSAVRTIAGVGTAETAFVDFFARGPVGVATRVTSLGDFVRRFGGLDRRSEASYAIQQYYLNGGQVSWVVRVGVGGAVATATITLADTAKKGTLQIDAASPGDWGNHLEVGVRVATDKTFDLYVREVQTSGTTKVVMSTETYRGVSMDKANRRFCAAVVNAGSALVKLTALGTEPPDGPASTAAGDAPADADHKPLTKGSDGDAFAPDGTLKDDAARTAMKTALLPTDHNGGMYALSTIEPFTFNLLCLPAAANLGDAGWKDAVTQAEAYCEGKRAFFLADIPATMTTVAAVITAATTGALPRSNNAAAYFPRIQIPDPLADGGARNVGASGTLAGIYAATDATRGVWKAPAGTDASLRNVGLAVTLTDLDHGALNPLGINVLRNFPIFGNVAWGARTLNGSDQQASQWKYIPVRRTALFIEESLEQGLRWVVFEPNDEPLWSQIRLNVGAFMHDLFRQGAFEGTTPRAAYFVKCDGETTTQNDIDRGIVNIVVGFAPLKPAEFVVIKIQQIAGQIQT